MVGVLPSVEDKLESETKKRDQLKSRRRDLRAKRQKHTKKPSKKAANAYIAGYVALLLGSMVLYAYTLPVVMPEIPAWVGMIQSLILAAPSFLMAELHKRSQYKDKIMRWLLRVGLGTSAGLVIFLGIARVTARSIMSKAASGSFLQTGTSSTGADTLLDVSVFLVFLFGILAEMAFSSCLLIRVKQDYEDHIPSELVEIELSEIGPEIKQAEDSVSVLLQLRAQIIKFPDAIESWCEEKKDELSIWYEEL